MSRSTEARSPRIEPRPPSLPGKARGFLGLLAAHLRRQWPAWLLSVAACQLATANYRLGYNSTPSLPQKWFLIHLNEPVTDDGQYLAFRWHGGRPYPDGIIFTKRVAGRFGDRVQRDGRHFAVNGLDFHALEFGMTGRRLDPFDIEEGTTVIPRDKYWVYGTHENSLDSRYSLLGFVDQQDVVGRAYPIF